MFAYIRGKLAEISLEHATVDVGGVGYKIFIPVNLLSLSPSIGDEITLYTSLVVREDSQKLFGFHSPNERNMFEKLSGLSGIGAKTALSIIGHMSYSDLLMAIQVGDAKCLTHIPGIGKKTAERIILELSGNMKKWATETPQDLPGAPNSTILSDATSALLNLGYNIRQINSALKKVLANAEDGEPELSSVISSALKQM